MRKTKVVQKVWFAKDPKTGKYLWWSCGDTKKRVKLNLLDDEYSLDDLKTLEYVRVSLP